MGRGKSRDNQEYGTTGTRPDEYECKSWMLRVTRAQSGCSLGKFWVLAGRISATLLVSVWWIKGEDGMSLNLHVSTDFEYPAHCLGNSNEAEGHALPRRPLEIQNILGGIHVHSSFSMYLQARCHHKRDTWGGILQCRLELLPKSGCLVPSLQTCIPLHERPILHCVYLFSGSECGFEATW